MKKFLTLLLAAAMTLSFAACGSRTTATPTAAILSPPTRLLLLNTVWSSYADDDKFSVVGGDYDEANMTEDAPGRFGVEDGDSLDSMLGFPAADADKADRRRVPQPHDERQHLHRRRFPRHELF